MVCGMQLVVLALGIGSTVAHAEAACTAFAALSAQHLPNAAASFSNSGAALIADATAARASAEPPAAAPIPAGCNAFGQHSSKTGASPAVPSNALQQHSGSGKDLQHAVQTCVCTGDAPPASFFHDEAHSRAIRVSHEAAAEAASLDQIQPQVSVLGAPVEASIRARGPGHAPDGEACSQLADDMVCSKAGHACEAMRGTGQSGMLPREAMLAPREM